MEESLISTKSDSFPSDPQSFLFINGYPFFGNINWYNSLILDCLFQPEDRIVEQQEYRSLNPSVWGSNYTNRPGAFLFRGFRQTAGVCRARLEIYGMSLSKAGKDFSDSIKRLKEGVVYKFPIELVSFQEYLGEVRDIIENDIFIHKGSFDNLRDHLLSIDLSIEGQDQVAHLYCLLAMVPDSTIVEYNLTQISTGDGAMFDQIVPKVREKIIVLTEGVTDAEFIQGALKLLYPHLLPYFQFINLAEYITERNASTLVNLVLSFAAAGVKHPIVALFDNDTTGISEMDRIPLGKLPPNIKVLKLPDIPIAERYPSIGPTGLNDMNINGSACGIELYLGVDILTQQDGLAPIIWTGYNRKKQKYQGEIKDKVNVQKLYRQKLFAKQGDFSDMDRVLQTIFRAFI
jgi:hypothetical protein